MDETKNNTGDLNTGNLNTGNLNTGNRNTGNRNTGDWNTGDWNTSNRNTGNWNTGDLNIGNVNTGNRNTGSRNTGDLNTGNWNTGDMNTGDLNTGDWNTGDWNTGDWNTGNRNTGFFCTETPPLLFFDKPVNLTAGEAISLIPHVELSVGAEFVPTAEMRDADKAAHPTFATIGGFLRAIPHSIQTAFPLAWAKMDDKEKAKWMGLPNFDAEKFLKCTGVDVRKPKHIVRIRLASGEEVSGEVIE